MNAIPQGGGGGGRGRQGGWIASSNGLELSAICGLFFSTLDLWNLRLTEGDLHILCGDVDRV